MRGRVLWAQAPAIGATVEDLVAETCGAPERRSAIPSLLIALRWVHRGFVGQRGSCRFFLCCFGQPQEPGNWSPGQAIDGDGTDDYDEGRWEQLVRPSDTCGR